MTNTGATATATITRPTVAQTTYREDGREVTATINADSVTLTLDDGTMAVVMAALRAHALERDATYRRTGLDYDGIAGSRAALVVDAVELARYRWRACGGRCRWGLAPAGTDLDRFPA